MNASPAIVVLGAHGQVGWELQRALAPIGHLRAFGREVDLLDVESLRRALRAAAPGVIVNAAAYTAVDAAERDEASAHAVNGVAVGVLAEHAASSGALLVHFGTDYVFDGSGSEPWTERSPTQPLNAYGRSKLAGERAIAASGCLALVLRTSWVYATRGNNFVRTMLRLATTRDSLRVVADQHGAPTGAALIADVTAHCIRGVLANPGLAGTYHLAAGGETTWYAYAQHVIRAARAAGWPVLVPDERVTPIPSSEYATPARRPSNSRLDTRALRSAFGLELPHWRCGVDHALADLLAAGPAAVTAAGAGGSRSVATTTTTPNVPGSAA